MWLLSVGDLFAERYRILREVGSGGMSHVFAAHDEELEEAVALKIIKPDIAQDENFVARFKREVRIARQIRHPNIVQVLEFGSTMAQDKRLYYLTMELLQGRDLREWLDESQKLSLPDTLRVGHQICDALGEAHRAGVTHRDIKPQNIFIDESGRLKLMDFGVLRHSSLPSMTTMGQLIGTPKYMSPEQVHRKEAVDHRSDVYSTGVLLFELATGEPPFDGESMIQVALKHVDEDPPRPSERNPELPPEFDEVILTCLEKDPDARYQSIEELRQRLQDIPASGAQKAADPTGDDTAVLELSTTARANAVASTFVSRGARSSSSEDSLPPTVPIPRPDHSTSHHTVRTRSSSTPEWKKRAVPAGAIVVLLLLIYFLIPPSKPPVDSLTGPDGQDGQDAAPSSPSTIASQTDPFGQADAPQSMRPATGSDSGDADGRQTASSNRLPSSSSRPSSNDASNNPGTRNTRAAAPRSNDSAATLTRSNPSTAEVTIRSTPAGANVQIDGKTVGTTPWKGEVSAGRRRITLSRSGYTTALETLNLSAGQPLTKRFDLAPVTRNVRVLFSANPGTEIHVDGKSLGTIPPNLEVELTTGEHRVLYRMPDYAEHDETIRVEADGDNSFSHRFPLPGPIRVTAQPYARVFLDGKDLGFTPVSVEKVSEGNHQLRLEREGFQTVEQTVTVKPFEINRFQFTLKKQ